jgi:hypothetical protein
LGLAVVCLIILVVLGVVAGLVLARAFGAAAARNEKRPGTRRVRRSAVVRAPARTMGKRAGTDGKPGYSSERPQPC